MLARSILILTSVNIDDDFFTWTPLCPCGSYLFRSGNIETNGDWFYNTTVEVQPSHVSIMETICQNVLIAGL